MSECSAIDYVAGRGPVECGWPWTTIGYIFANERCIVSISLLISIYLSQAVSAQDSVATQTLPLKHVRLLEQVQCKRYCLVVATSSLTWYLFFKDTISLHAWLHDIRNRCPLMKIGLPTNFRHEMHVTYDAAASEITVRSIDPDPNHVHVKLTLCPKGFTRRMD